MATYFVGDLQGCYTQFVALLSHIQFNPKTDHVICVGDLVNRGPESLEVLRFIRDEPAIDVVLGNHDLFLLALAYDCVVFQVPHTMQPILDAPDREQLLTWLRQQPILRLVGKGVAVHAGIPPQWSIAHAKQRAEAVEVALQSDEFKALLTALEIPDNHTHQDAVGMDGLVYTVNALTRMRFCQADGTLNFKDKTLTSLSHPDELPWYDWYMADQDIFFGHWASLRGGHPKPHIYALDTGCVYGEKLTAIRLEDKRWFDVPGVDA